MMNNYQNMETYRYYAWQYYQQMIKMSWNMYRNRCPVQNPVQTTNPTTTEFKDWYNGYVKVDNPMAENEAKKLYKKFYHFKPREIKRVDFRMPESLVYLGDAAQIDYITDKFKGKQKIHYFHEFGNGYPYPQLYSDEKGDVLFIVNNFKIKPEGIINANKKTH